MKKIIYAVLACLLAVVQVLPALADGNRVVSIGDKLVLAGGYEAVCTSLTRDGRPVYTADMSTPVYMSDLVTKIDTSWKTDAWGDYINTKNIGSSYVNGEYTAVSDSQMNTVSWKPDVYLQTLGVKTKTAPVTSKAKILSVDPLNKNYKNNTLEWDFGNGVVRRLRNIEGVHQEYYVVGKKLDYDLVIQPNFIASAAFSGKKGEVIAFDNGNTNVGITLNSDGSILLSADKMKDAHIKYPIIIDPDLTFESTAEDGSLGEADAVYATARTAAAATDAIYSGIWIAPVCNNYVAAYPIYAVARGLLYFNTAPLVGLTITAATLSIKPESISITNGESIQVQSGMPTYPAMPFVAGDYLYSHYSGNYGSVAMAALVDETYAVVALDTSIINQTGYTKLALRTTGDITATAPTGNNLANFYMYEAGSGLRPVLTVTFNAASPGIVSAAASYVAKTTATLNATVTDDASEGTVEVRFGYGGVSQTAVNFNNYATITPWVDGYTKNQAISLPVTGLAAATPYFYRVQVRSSGFTVTSTAEQTFTTETNIATLGTFVGFVEANSIHLNWTKGAGASRTLVRYAVDTYPATTSDGTQIYLDTGTNYTHTGLIAGQTYYYTAWGESGGVYSATPLYLAMTSGIPVEAIPSTTGMTPTKWNQATDYTKLAGLGAFYWGVNIMADNIGMPRNSFWQLIAFGSCVILGGLLYLKTKAPSAAMIMSALLMAGWVVAGVLSGFFVFFSGALILGAWAMRPQGART